MFSCNGEDAGEGLGFRTDFLGNLSLSGRDSALGRNKSKTSEAILSSIWVTSPTW